MLNNPMEIGTLTSEEALHANGDLRFPERPLKARILLADDHFLIAETLSILLAPHFDVVGVLNTANSSSRKWRV